MAGSVKARRAQRAATSDWMAIERERGISVTSTVLQFDFGPYRVNLLDTPGHQDFGEDTYRTLVAADAAIMLLDGGKGVEPITEKLYAVCRMRQIPVFTFVNKMDRPSLPPLQILDEIRTKLGLDNYPVNWPIGSGTDFCGVIDRRNGEATLFERQERGAREALSRKSDLSDPWISAKVGPDAVAIIREELEMLGTMSLDHDEELVRGGLLSPVFFGSAVTNFGVEQLLRGFLELGPPPVARASVEGEVLPSDSNFSAFVFKTQANMDPRHRDRIAFLRVVSGRFEGGMEAINSRTGKTIRLSNPKEFFGRDRETVTEAYAGDILGLMNSGNLLIGDTLAWPKSTRFPGIPRFSPEHFAVVHAAPSSRKQLDKGLNELLQEGAIQGFRDPLASGADMVLGAVGPLQFEVLQYRLQAEYNAKVTVMPLPYRLARYVQGPDDAIAALRQASLARMVQDQRERNVALFRDPYSLDNVARNHPRVTFLAVAAED